MRALLTRIESPEALLERRERCRAEIIEGDFVERMTRAQARRLWRRAEGVHAAMMAAARAEPTKRGAAAVRAARLGGKAMPRSASGVARLLWRYLDEGARGLIDGRGAHGRQKRRNPDPRLWLALTACVEAGIPAATAHAMIARFAIEEGRSWPSLRTVQLRLAGRRCEVRARNLIAAAHNLN